jgi:hypothetical protein
LSATKAAPKPVRKASSRVSKVASTSTDNAKREQLTRPRRQGLRQRD